MCEPWAERYPHLAAWLSDARTEHQLIQLRDLGEVFDSFAAPWEEIITRLEAVGPDGLPGRRRTFRTNHDGFLNTRAELNVAYQVARTGVSFAFGRERGVSEPDIHCVYPDARVAIEVTTKDPEGITDLHLELEEALGDCDVYVTLDVPSGLRISKAARLASIGVIRDTYEKMSDGFTTVPLPQSVGRAELTKPSPLGPGQVTSTNNFQGELAEFGLFIQEVVKAKAGQSLSGGWSHDTLLVIDVARLGMAVWMRPDALWPASLMAMDLGWDSLPFLGVALAFSDLTKVGIRGAAVPRPGLDPREIALFDRASKALGLHRQPEDLAWNPGGVD